jgi:hypothetical protein
LLPFETKYNLQGKKEEQKKTVFHQKRFNCEQPTTKYLSATAKF